MKKVLLWFRTLETRIWGENMNSNKWFATVCILVAALIGAIAATIISVNTISGTSLSEVLIRKAVYAVALLAVWNVAESIYAAPNPLAALGRSALVVFAIAIMAAAGFLAAIIIYVVVGLWIVVTLISAFTGQMFKSEKGKDYILQDGTRVKESKGILGESYYHGNDGHDYHRNGEIFTRND